MYYTTLTSCISAVAIAAICFLVSLSSCISFICRLHKSKSSKNEDSEKRYGAAAIVVQTRLGRNPLTIEHNVQDQDRQPSDAVAGYDSFESDDDDEQNVNIAYAANYNQVYPTSNVSDYGQEIVSNYNQNEEATSHHPEGDDAYYQEAEMQETGLVLYDFANEDGDVKFHYELEELQDEENGDVKTQEHETS